MVQLPSRMRTSRADKETENDSVAVTHVHESPCLRRAKYFEMMKRNREHHLEVLISVADISVPAT